MDGETTRNSLIARRGKRTKGRRRVETGGGNTLTSLVDIKLPLKLPSPLPILPEAPCGGLRHARPFRPEFRFGAEIRSTRIITGLGIVAPSQSQRASSSFIFPLWRARTMGRVWMASLFLPAPSGSFRCDGRPFGEVLPLKKHIHQKHRASVGCPTFSIGKMDQATRGGPSYGGSLVRYHATVPEPLPGRPNPPPTIP